MRIGKAMSLETSHIRLLLLLCVALLFDVHGKYLWRVNLTTLFLGKLRPPKRLTSTSCTYFRQKLTTAFPLLLQIKVNNMRNSCETKYHDFKRNKREREGKIQETYQFKGNCHFVLYKSWTSY